MSHLTPILFKLFFNLSLSHWLIISARRASITMLGKWQSSGSVNCFGKYIYSQNSVHSYASDVVVTGINVIFIALYFTKKSMFLLHPTSFTGETRVEFARCFNPRLFGNTRRSGPLTVDTFVPMGLGVIVSQINQHPNRWDHPGLKKNKS